MSLFDDTQLSILMDGLVTHGWVTLPMVGTEALRQQMRDELQSLDASGRLTQAGVGRGAELHQNPQIRRDKTYWLDPEASPIQAEYLAGLDQLRQCLNRALFLGLRDAEAHYAVFGPEDFYQRHLDRFRRNGVRAVSTVLYLNPDWTPAEGGAMEIYDGGEPDSRRIAQIWPEDGTFACFLSDRIWHAVAPTRRPRYSIAGWLRQGSAAPL